MLSARADYIAIIPREFIYATIQPRKKSADYFDWIGVTEEFLSGN